MSAETGSGGEAACWAQIVCDDCGAVAGDGHRPGCGAATSALRLRTRLCDLLGIEFPVLNAPMGGGDAPGALAAAVAAAGGLGLIGGTTAGGDAWLSREIGVARNTTDRPFGVGLLGHRPGAHELMAVALDEGVRVIAISFADPTPFVTAAHARDAAILCQVRTVDEARQAAAARVDVVVAQGTEAGGHTGRISTFPLLPAVVDAVAPVPVVAAGGIADGRAVAAALVLGAEGVWVGTRFVATVESGVSAEHKARVVAASSGDTVLTDVLDIARRVDWPVGVSGRAISEAFTRRWHGHEAELRASMTERPGEQAAAPGGPQGFWAGEAAELVRSVQGAGDVVRGLVAGAVAVLERRPAEVLHPSPIPPA